MKRSWSLFPILVASALKAQTNSAPPPATTNAEPPAAAVPSLSPTNAPAHAGAVSAERPGTEIFSDSANFDLKSRVAVYIGHVRVLDPQMKMTCDLMTATVPESGRPNSIVAEQNVVIDAVDNEGKSVHAIGDKAVYTYHVVTNVVDLTTNETVVLTGNPDPRVQRGDDWLTGDTITWDRVHDSFSATHMHTMITPETKPRTNAPATPSTTGKKSNP